MLEKHTQNNEKVLDLLRIAMNRAEDLKKGVIVSISQAIKKYDTISIFNDFRRNRLGDCFFWEQPSKQIALVGYGSIVSIETKGETRFAETIHIWRSLLHNAVLGSIQEEDPTDHHTPLLFGGFAFDPHNPHTELWKDFPDGLLLLPHILIHQSPHGSTLTLNTLIQPGDDIKYRAEEIVQTIEKTSMLIEQTYPYEHDMRENVPYHLNTHDLRPASEWTELIDKIVSQIQGGIYTKVVLARSINVAIEAQTRQIFDISRILYRLKYHYPNTYIFALQRGQRYFVGATPEQLASVQDGQIQTMALAGSAPRGSSIYEDAHIGRKLLTSEKNNQEHMFVIEMLCNKLKALCSKVSVTETPYLLKLANVHHLITPIVGELLPGRNIIDVIADLHPTPAVGGLPLQQALEAIREGEKMDRGWYAGPIGWIDANGNGEFAVALRSALICADEATLFAGCGIVAGSDAQSEYVESCLKFKAMLRGLGQKED